jgi:hypothetical protein
MSVRLTKKSLVSAPTRSVNTPCPLPPWLVPSTRMPPTSTVISGAVRPQQLGAVEQQFLGLTT